MTDDSDAASGDQTNDAPQTTNDSNQSAEELDEVTEFIEDDNSDAPKSRPVRRHADSEFDEVEFVPSGELIAGLILVYGALCLGVIGVIVAACTPYFITKRPDLVPWLILHHVMLIGSMFAGSILLALVGRITTLVGVRPSEVGLAFYGCILLAVLGDLFGLGVTGTTIASLIYTFDVPDFLVKLNELSPAVSFSGTIFFVVFLWKLTAMVDRPKQGILAAVALVSWIAFPVLYVLLIKGTLSFFYTAIAVGVCVLVGLISYGNLLTYLRQALNDLRRSILSE